MQNQNERDPGYRYNENEQYDLLVKELFGANRLHIVKALDKLVTYLERKHDLKI